MSSKMELRKRKSGRSAGSLSSNGQNSISKKKDEKERTYAQVVQVQGSLKVAKEVAELRKKNMQLRQLLKQQASNKMKTTTSNRHEEEGMSSDSSTSEEEDESGHEVNPKEAARDKVELQRANRGRSKLRESVSSTRGRSYVRPKVKRSYEYLDDELQPTHRFLANVSEDTLDHEMLRCRRFTPEENVCFCGKMYTNFTMLVIHKLSCGKEVNKPEEAAPISEEVESEEKEFTETLKDPDFLPPRSKSRRQ